MNSREKQIFLLGYQSWKKNRQALKTKFSSYFTKKQHISKQSQSESNSFEINFVMTIHDN